MDQRTTEPRRRPAHYHVTALSPIGDRLETIYRVYLDALKEAQALTVEALPVGGGLATSRNRTTGEMVNVIRDVAGATVAQIAVSAACRRAHEQLEAAR